MFFFARLSACHCPRAPRRIRWLGTWNIREVWDVTPEVLLILDLASVWLVASFTKSEVKPYQDLSRSDSLNPIPPVTARWLTPSIPGNLLTSREISQCLGRNVYRDRVAPDELHNSEGRRVLLTVKDLLTYCSHTKNNNLIDIEQIVMCGPWEMATAKKTANIFLSWSSVMQLNSSQLTWNADKHPFVRQSLGYAGDSGTLWPPLSSSEHAGPRFVDPGGRFFCWIVTAEWLNVLILLGDMDWY